MTVFYTPLASIPEDIDDLDGVASDWDVLEKGSNELPFSLVHDEDNGQVRVVIQNPDLTDCPCEATCQGFTATTCAGAQGGTIVLNVEFSEEEALELQVRLMDALGNASTFIAYSLLAVVPARPLVALIEDEGPRHVLVGIPVTSAAGVSLSEAAVQFQIERYLSHEANREIWKDWSPISELPGALKDWPVPPGQKRGYRVRFRPVDDHTSEWSLWGTIST